MTTKAQFIKIGDIRYRLTNIKRYEPFEFEGPNKYGIYIYYSAMKTGGRDYFRFKSKKERDEILFKLDDLFNC